MPKQNHHEGRPGIFSAALFGFCPDCAAKSLFNGVAQFAPKCENCGLDFHQYNVGDGPAAFLTLGVGATVIVLAILLDIAVRPPFWLHALIWIPVTVALTVLSLRVAKGLLLITEHRRQAHELRKDELE